MLAIPGLGPVVAAGRLASTAVVAAAGAATGGIVGALVDARGRTASMPTSIPNPSYRPNQAEIDRMRANWPN